MAEDIGKIIHNGIGTFTGNLSIIIPFILNSFMAFISAIIFFVVGIILIFGPSLSSLEETSNPEQLVIIFLQLISQHILGIVVLVILFALFFTFFNSFFAGGAIGMARQATETGKTGLSTMIESGKKNLINLFLTQILIGLFYLAGIVFLVPGAMRADLSQLLTQETAGDNLLLAFGFLLIRIYDIILNLVFAVARYALVIDNLGPVDSILASFRFFKDHKIDVLIVWLISFVALEISLQAWLLNPFLGLFVLGFVFGFILEPLSAIWWVRLYMVRTAKKVYFNDLLAHPNDLARLRSDQ